jgi:hypothetical protein
LSDDIGVGCSFRDARRSSPGTFTVNGEGGVLGLLVLEEFFVLPKKKIPVWFVSIPCVDVARKY